MDRALAELLAEGLIRHKHVDGIRIYRGGEQVYIVTPKGRAYDAPGDASGLSGGGTTTLVITGDDEVLATLTAAHRTAANAAQKRTHGSGERRVQPTLHWRRMLDRLRD